MQTINTTTKRNCIILAGLFFVIGIIIFFFKSGTAGQQPATLCGISLDGGQTFTVHQGTVGRYGSLGIGLLSVKTDSVNIQFRNTDTNVVSDTITLRECESVNFNGYTIHLLSINDLPDEPYGRPGSGSGSIGIFISKD